MANKKSGDINLKVLSVIILFSTFFVLVSAAINWNGNQNIIYNYSENQVVTFDFNSSLVYTEGNTFNDIGEFAFGTAGEYFIKQNNVTLDVSTVSSWLNLSGEKYKNLTIDSKYDNRSGLFRIPMVVNKPDEEGSFTTIEFFTFNITPVNDIPEFVSYNESYTFPADEAFYLEDYIIEIDDEEIEQGTADPLNYSFEILECTVADWVNTSDFDCNNVTERLVLLSNNSEGTELYFQYTNPDDISKREVGTYNVSLNITDSPNCTKLESLLNDYYPCPAEYNVSNSISENFTIIIESTLEIWDISGCEGATFNESQEDAVCNITVKTRRPNDEFLLESDASFTHYGVSPSNSSWFYENNSIHQSGEDYIKNISININTSKKFVGNWTINLTATESPTGDNSSKSFNISIIKNSSDGPNISEISDENFSAQKLQTISINVTDEDFLIEDKSTYNETLNFAINVTSEDGNASVFNDESFFNVTKIEIEENMQRAKIEFTPQNEHEGNYTVNLSVTDEEGLSDFFVFNMTIYQNNFPQWNQTIYEYNFTVNSTEATTIENITNWNLTNQSLFAFDNDSEDILTFINSSNAPPNFNLSSEGILNFQPWKQDVGYWEFNITASDGNLENSSIWKINVTNINSLPEIAEFTVNSNSASPFNTSEGEDLKINFNVDDFDLMIDEEVYSENISISNITLIESNATTNLTFNFIKGSCGDDYCPFTYEVTPEYSNVGDYTVFIEVVDKEGATGNYTFNLTVLENNTAPTINNLTNLSTSILEESFTYQIDATDTKDAPEELTYNITNFSEEAPLFQINESGFINFTINETNAGEWTYQINVTDNGESDGANELSTIANFTLFVHGYPNVTLPTNETVINLTEGLEEILNFTLDYSVNNTNLTYNIYLDKIVSLADGNYIYTEQEFINSSNFTYLDGENLSINLIPEYNDETYNLLKNFTLELVNPNYLDLARNITLKTNITHTNQNITFHTDITSENQNLTKLVNNPIEINLSEHFEDIDVFDLEYNQLVNFTARKPGGERSDLTDNAELNESTWMFSLTSSSAISETIEITALEWDYDNQTLLNNVTSNNFTVTFLDDDTGSDDSPSSGGSSSTTRTEHYALKIITPDNIKISDENFITVNFSLYNSGQVALSGIDLKGLVDLSGIITDDLRITFSEDFVDSLAVGEQKNYSMRIDVNTGAVGKYDITIFGNVTTPRFSDWATFSVEVLAVDESKLSQLLIFTEKLVSENPECLELREFFNEAKNMFDERRLIESEILVNQIITACQESISRNEQIVNHETKIRTTLIYVLIATVSILVFGFIYYTVRKLRFNKLKNKEYI